MIVKQARETSITNNLKILHNTSHHTIKPLLNTHLATVVQKVDNAIHRISTIHWIAQLVSLALIRWIVIIRWITLYPTLNYWGLIYKIVYPFASTTFWFTGSSFYTDHFATPMATPKTCPSSQIIFHTKQRANGCTQPRENELLLS